LSSSFFPTLCGNLLEFSGVDKSYDIGTFQIKNHRSKKDQKVALQFFRYNNNSKASDGINTTLLLMLQKILLLSGRDTTIYAQVSPDGNESPYLFYCSKLGFIECSEPRPTLEGRFSVDLRDLVYLKSPKDIDATIDLICCKSYSPFVCAQVASKITFHDLNIGDYTPIQPNDNLTTFFNTVNGKTFTTLLENKPEETNFYSSLNRDCD